MALLFKHGAVNTGTGEPLFCASAIITKIIFCQAFFIKCRTRQHKYIRNYAPDGMIKHGVSPFKIGAMASDPSNKFFSAWSYPKSWLSLADEYPEVAKKIEWFRKRAPEELYDLKNDPFETKNVVASSEYAEVLIDLRAKCDARMASQGDEGMKTVNALKEWQSQQHQAGGGFMQDSNAPVSYPGRRKEAGN